jgi:hypothetical protein
MTKMYSKLSLRHLPPLVPCLALALMLCAAVSGLAQPPPAAPQDDPTQMTAQVLRILCIADKPVNVRLSGTGILWLTGDPERWSMSPIQAIKRWVGEGHVCWVDVALATRFGLTASWGASSGVAVVAEGAAAHPLAAGVRRVQCADTFRYMRGVPTGAQPILVADHRAEQVVLAAWPFGRGLFVFRPQAKPDEVTWESTIERRWIEPDVADGGRLLNNLNSVSLATLAKAGFRFGERVLVIQPAPEAASPGMKSLLEAFWGP